MGRIKQGLDYFPLNTDFMHDLKTSIRDQNCIRVSQSNIVRLHDPALYPVLSIFGRGLLYSCR